MTAAPPSLAHGFTASPEAVGLDQLYPHPANRKRFDANELEELARSLLEVGQITPAIVRPRAKGGYELLAGERRWRAAKICGLPRLAVIVRGLSDEQALEVLAIENNQREDPDALDEAELYKAMLTVRGYNVAKIAARLKRSDTYVRERLRLLRLIEPAKKLVIEGTVPVQHAILLAGLSPADQKRAITGHRMNGSAYHIEGLFREERTLFDDERDTRVAVSLAEFRDWIRREVRLDPRAEVVGELFPETVAAVQEADATRQKVLSLTTDYRVSDHAKDPKVRTIGHDHWKRADGKKGSKPCRHAELGVVVAGEARGEGFQVCIRKDKCEIHWPQQAKAAAARAKAKAREASGAPAKSTGDPAATAKSQLEQLREEGEAAAFEAAFLRWQKAEPVLLEALVTAVRRQPVGPDSKVGKHLIERCWARAEVKKHFTPKTPADLLHFLVLGDLLDDDLPRLDSAGAQEELAEHLKKWGVDAEKIVDQVAPKPAACASCKRPFSAQEAKAGFKECELCTQAKAAAKPVKKLAGDVRRAKAAKKAKR